MVPDFHMVWNSSLRKKKIITLQINIEPWKGFVQMKLHSKSALGWDLNVRSTPEEAIQTRINIPALTSVQT